MIAAVNVTGNPLVNLFAVIILTTFLAIYKGVLSGVYRKWPVDVLESTIYLNLILFASSTMYILELRGNQATLANISLTMYFITVIVILGYHTVSTFFKGNRMYTNVTKCFNHKRNTRENDDFEDNMREDCDLDDLINSDQTKFEFNVDYEEVKH